MRIPLPNGQRVAEQPFARQGTLLSQRDTSFSEAGAAATKAGVALGNSVAGAAQDYQRAEEKARKEAKERAEAISQAEADADYENSATTRLYGGSSRAKLVDAAFNESGPSDTLTPDSVDYAPGFLSTRGKDASEQSASVIEKLDEDRQRIAKEKFADPDARAKWMARSEGFLADSHRAVESHAAHQFRVAQKDALEGKRQTSLDMVANARDSETVARIAADYEASARMLGDSPEGIEADLEVFRRDALTTRIASLLNEGNLSGAEAQYEVGKEGLGVAAPKVRDSIDQAKRTQGRVANDVEAERQAATMVAGVVQPNGRVDATAAAELVDKVPEGPLRDEIRQRVEHRLVVANKHWDQKVSGFYDGAFSTYLKTGHLRSTDEKFQKAKSWLIDNSPEEWDKLRLKSRADAEYFRRLREHIPGETDAQRRQLIALKADMAERPDYYKDLTPAQFLMEDLTQGLSPPGLTQAGTIFAGTQKEDPIKAAEYKEFVSDTIAESPGLSSKENKARFRARMGDLRRDHLKDNDGKEPDFEQSEKMKAAALVEIVTSKGRLWDTKKPAYQVPFDDTSPRPPRTKPLGPPASARPAVAKPAAAPTAKNQQAIGWARAHPDDPRSAAILKKLGAK